jgi:amino acid transporter
MPSSTKKKHRSLVCAVSLVIGSVIGCRYFHAARYHGRPVGLSPLLLLGVWLVGGAVSLLAP